jgi:pyruvate/2-oxoglutarate dehydrogenase complex dihydrolipoamide acyltransferase (E2) component
MSSSSTDSASNEVLVAMPQMGVSVAEGTVAVWHKQVGDWVEADEIICEVSTDKIDTDIPSPAAGRVTELLVAEEQTVPVGTPLARIATDASPGEAHPAEQDRAAAARLEGPAAAQLEGTDQARAARQAPTASEEPAASQSPAASQAPAADQSPAARTAPAASRVSAATSPVYSPVVQRLAAAHGIDLATITGSGRGGRVRKQDVLAAVATREREPRTGATTSQPGATGAPDGAAAVANAGARAAVPPAPTSTAPVEPLSSEPLSRMRRAIAEHMTRSLHTAAHCTTIIEADFSRIEKRRSELDVSPLPLVARAVVEALQRHPTLNATLDDQQLTRHRDVNLGIAVSLGERGLIVPVIHRAQELSTEGLAARIRELARRARADELRPDDVRDGTFTITNPGSFGSIASTPIINQPQVAILDLEAVVKRPVAVSEPDGVDAIAIRPMAYLCLSWDHRALDGALAAQFLATLRGIIEGRA